MRYLPIILIILWLQQSGTCQDTVRMNRGLSVNFAYYGETLFHPGVKVGAEFPLWSKANESGKKARTMQRNISLITSTGFYIHPGSHSGVFVNAEGCFRKIRQKSGFKIEALAAIGYVGKINAGTTYVVGDDGSISERKVAGRSYFTTSAGFGLGQDLWVKKQVPIAWHIRPWVVLWIPYNTTVMPSFDLEMGITYRFIKKSK